MKANSTRKKLERRLERVFGYPVGVYKNTVDRKVHPLHNPREIGWYFIRAGSKGKGKRYYLGLTLKAAFATVAEFEKEKAAAKVSV